MNHPTLKSFLAASALAFALPMAALANPGFDGSMGPRGAMHGMHHAHGGPGMLPFLRRLDLSETQQDKVFAIMHALTPQLREQGKIARKAHIELRELSQSDKFDEAKARTLAETQARAHAEMGLLRAKSTQQVFALLTPEQRRKFEEIKAERAERMRPGEHGPRGPQGPNAPHMRHGAADDWDPLASRGEL